VNPWTRVNLVLAGIAGVLLLIAAWPAPDGRVDRLTGLDVGLVQSIRVETDDRLVLALRREGDDWRLLHPLAGPASAGRVAQLLAIARAPVHRPIDAAADSQAFGLDRPRAVLQLEATRITFGDPDPTRRYRYVAAAGRVAAIDDLYYHLLTLPARHFTAR
jgi:hypothetical protein